MAVLSLVLGLAGALVAIAGILVPFDVLPAFIEGEEQIGPIVMTTGFLWGVAVILLLAAIAIGANRGPGEGYD